MSTPPAPPSARARKYTGGTYVGHPRRPLGRFGHRRHRAGPPRHQQLRHHEQQSLRHQQRRHRRRIREQVQPGGTYLGDRAVRWNASGTAATELGHIGTDSSGDTVVEAQAVNTAGTAVGYAVKYNGGTTSAPAPSAGTPPAPPPRSWATSARAAAAGRSASPTTSTRAGTAVGYAEKYSPAGTHLGTRRPLGRLGHRRHRAGQPWHRQQRLTRSAKPYAVNSAGTAVGYASSTARTARSSAYTRAVRWDASGTAATELGNDINNGISGGVAWAVNTAGVAVGYGNKFAGGTFLGDRAMLWDSTRSPSTSTR